MGFRPFYIGFVASYCGTLTLFRLVGFLVRFFRLCYCLMKFFPIADFDFHCPGLFILEDTYSCCTCNYIFSCMYKYRISILLFFGFWFWLFCCRLSSRISFRNVYTTFPSVYIRLSWILYEHVYMILYVHVFNNFILPNYFG